MYAIFLDWSEDAFVIRSLGKDMIPDARIQSVELIGYKGDLKVTQTSGALEIQTPEKRPHDYAYAFKIKLSGEVGDRMIATPAVTMAEEQMSYSDINTKHKGAESTPK